MDSAEFGVFLDKIVLGVIRASAVMIRYEGFPTSPREAAKRQVFPPRWSGLLT